jgi:NUMOD1 domain/NUMOD3 motif
MSINNTGINNPFFGKRHNFESRKKIGETLRSLIRENIKPKSLIRENIKPKVIKAETRLKLSFRCQGVCVKVFDYSNNYIREFPTITSAAKYFNISNRTVSRYLDKNIFYLGYIFKSYIKDK